MLSCSSDCCVFFERALGKVPGSTGYFWAVVFFLCVWMMPIPSPASDFTGNGNVSVDTGDSYDSVYGQRSRSGQAVASGSTVNVTGGTISRSLYGGWASSSNGFAEADFNSVLVSGGLAGFDGPVYGGRADSSAGDATADGNRVVLDGSFDFGADVQMFGGYATISGKNGRAESADNLVDIGGTSTLDLVVGGEAKVSGAAPAMSFGNTVRFSGASVNRIYGGYAYSSGNASAFDNMVSFRSGTFSDIVGGEVTSYGGDAVGQGNVVTITGGTGVGTGNVFGASVQADVGKAVAKGNTVSVFQASISGEVSGGFVRRYSATGLVTGNSAVVGTGARVSGDAVGGAMDVTTSGGSVTFNTVAVVDGGQVDSDVIGGLAKGENVSTSYNTVLIRGGIVGGNIYGGSSGSGGVARHNNVIIGVGADLDDDTSLFGGSVGGVVVDAASSGNTLFVDSWQGSVARVAGFENLHFVLPAPGAPVDVPMLTVTDAQPKDFIGSTVTAQLPDIITGGRAYLGDKFTLILDKSGAIENASTGHLVSLLQGYATYFDGVLSKTSTTVQLQLTDMRMNPRIAALTEARAAATGLLNQGADLAADTGLRHARDAAGTEGESWRPFAAMYGGTSRYHTGSRADTEGISALTGITGCFSSASSRRLVGGFLEFGRAHLDTFNGFTVGDVNGRGSSRYVGIGILTRFDLTSGPLSGWYAEGVGRVGNAETEWYSADLRDNMDRPAEYDLSNPYYGFHVGLGHVFSFGEVADLDVYGKFFWMHQGSDSANMNGEIVDFDDVDSRRLRMGMRLDYKMFDGLTPYVGAAWEHEYSGTASAVARDFSIPDASLKGDSGIFELGMSMEPYEKPLTLDFAVVGTTGARDSIGGHLSLLYRF